VSSRNAPRPFVPLILFFITGFAGGWAYAWLWFLLILITAIIVYGPAGRRGSRQCEIRAVRDKGSAR